MRGFLEALILLLDKIRARGVWAFLQAQSQIVFTAEYATGTVTVTNGSTSVVGSGTTFTVGMTGRKFRAGGNEVYTVTYVDATHLTLNVGYVGASASGLSYSLFLDTYALPADCAQLIKWWDATNQRWIAAWPASEVADWMYLTLATPGYPVKAGQFGVSSGIPQVIFWPAPLVAALVPFFYQRRPNTPTGPASTIDAPATFDSLLVQGMKWMMLANLQVQVPGQPPITIESGVLEHERNRFYELLEERWKEQSRVLGDVGVVIGRADSGYGCGNVALEFMGSFAPIEPA